MATTGTDVLRNADGSLYHLGVKEGDIHPRLITVGSYGRAERLSKLLTDVKVIKSERGFHWYTGTYKSVGVSVCAIGMGAPMMDFFVREVSAVSPNDLAIVRVGTCGLLGHDLQPGSLVVVDRCGYIYRNYAKWDGCLNMPELDHKGPPYIITKPVPADKSLSDQLHECAKSSNMSVVRGTGVCGESFYSTQGRRHPHWDDECGDLENEMVKQGVTCWEMETHQLYHLGSTRKTSRCHVSACHIGVLNRLNPEMPNVSDEALTKGELTAGKAAMEALVAFKLAK